MPIDVRGIARRAAGKALAERGMEAHAVPHPSGPALAGVHVAVDAAPAPAGAERRGRDVVSAACLASTADGATFAFEPGAIVTPLARDEARRRGIRLTERSTSAGRRRVAVGSDHGGFALKQDVVAWVGEVGCEAIDFGTRDERPCDYPDFARAVAEAVASGQCDLGVVVDGAGIGSAIAANKVPGVRAATCCDVAMARNAREHNFANVLSLGARMISRATAHDVLSAFLATAEGEERHARRVEKITAIERHYSRARGSGVSA
jgi:ribose 5-phosphate isomerase B